MARPFDDRPLVKIVIPLSLRSPEDDDLIALLQNCKGRPALIKAALRGHSPDVSDDSATDEFDEMFDDLEF